MNLEKQFYLVSFPTRPVVGEEDVDSCVLACYASLRARFNAN